MTPTEKIIQLKTLLAEAKEALMNRDPHTRDRQCYDSGQVPCQCTLCKINEELKLQVFEVWIEGYTATGQHEQAYTLGTFEANTFEEACMKAMIANNWDLSSYNAKSNSYWACKFFDNEEEARKSHG